MKPDPRTIALIVAAGRGERAGGGVPKQFRMVAGKAVLTHATDALLSHPTVTELVVMVGADQHEQARAALGERAVSILTGGLSRQESVRAGLEWIAENGGATQVLIHDAARPFLPPAVIDRLMLALEEHDGAIPVLPVVDTLVMRDDHAVGETVDRDALARVQTPQAFRFNVILSAHRDWAQSHDATDDAQIARAAGNVVALVQGDSMLEKLTHPADFAAAQQRMAPARTIRTGMGYDVHRLVPREELWLGGVQIAHDKGLSGHSDADVALHAIVDAILGALAEGDIGSHFPPSDPQWRGAPSARFVTFCRDRIAARNGMLNHIDLTIICEVPKIGPHRDAMRARIAELLDVPIHRVSVKATTTERLGFAGRGEGVAAQAVATLSLPDVF